MPQDGAVMLSTLLCEPVLCPFDARRRLRGPAMLQTPPTDMF